jgi:hypothetical protein
VQGQVIVIVEARNRAGEVKRVIQDHHRGRTSVEGYVRG